MFLCWLVTWSGPNFTNDVKASSFDDFYYHKTKCCVNEHVRYKSKKIIVAHTHKIRRYTLIHETHLTTHTQWWYNNEKQDWWILDGHKMECALIINFLVLLPKRQKLTKRIILFFTFSYNHNVDAYHNILVVATLALAVPSVAPWLTCCFKIFNGSCWVEVIPRGGIFRRI